MKTTLNLPQWRFPGDFRNEDNILLSLSKSMPCKIPVQDMRLTLHLHCIKEGQGQPPAKSPKTAPSLPPSSPPPILRAGDGRWRFGAIPKSRNATFSPSSPPFREESKATGFPAFSCGVGKGSVLSTRSYAAYCRLRLYRDQDYHLMRTLKFISRGESQ